MPSRCHCANRRPKRGRSQLRWPAVVICCDLVGGWPTPLKNMSHLGIINSQLNGKRHVPNHQPDVIMIHLEKHWVGWKKGSHVGRVSINYTIRWLQVIKVQPKLRAGLQWASAVLSPGPTWTNVSWKATEKFLAFLPPKHKLIGPVDPAF